MNDSELLSVRVSPELKAAWQGYCRSRGGTSSEVIRAVMRHMTCAVAVGEFAVEPESPDRGRVRTEVRFSASEFEAVEKLAAEVGTSKGKWITDLVRAYITRQPQFGLLELQAIGESSAQLRAIGRNLNQIALALNRGGDHSSDATLCRELVLSIERHTEMVQAAIRSNLDRWRVTWRRL